MEDSNIFVLDYDFFLSIKDQVENSGIMFWSMNTVKAIALIALGFQFIYLPWKQSLEAETGGQAEFTLKKILSTLGVVIVVLSYDKILSGLDWILGAIEVSYIEYDVEVSRNVYAKEEIIHEYQNSAESSIEGIAGQINNYINPMYWILQGCEFVCMWIDKFIYGIFLGERFFIIWVLKALGGIAIGMFAFDKTRQWFYNWLGVYIAVYLLIIPYIMINVFTNNFYKLLLIEVESSAFFEQGLSKAPWEQDSNTVFVLILIFVSVLKFRLFKKSHELVYKVFSSLQDGK